MCRKRYNEAQQMLHKRWRLPVCYYNEEKRRSVQEAILRRLNEKSKEEVGSQITAASATIRLLCGRGLISCRTWTVAAYLPPPLFVPPPTSTPSSLQPFLSLCNPHLPLLHPLTPLPSLSYPTTLLQLLEI